MFCTLLIFLILTKSMSFASKVICIIMDIALRCKDFLGSQ